MSLPSDSAMEIKYVDFPLVSSVAAQVRLSSGGQTGVGLPDSQ
jgi:hypothetical protein